MKKFSFQLNTVLEYKKQVLDVLKNQHWEIINKIIDQERLISRLEMRYKESNEDFNKKKADGVSIVEALGFEAYLRVLSKKIREEYDKLDELKKEEEKRRDAVVKAKQEIATIEKLKERKQEEYNKDLQKSEEQLVEEFVTYGRVLQMTGPQ